MEFLAVFLLLLLITGASFYLLICVDPNNQSILGKIYRLVFNTLPVYIRKIFGNKIVDYLSGAMNYVFNTNHPLVQYFYGLVAVGGFIVYSVCGFLRIFKENPEVHYVHSLVGSALALYSFYSYYQACRYSAGLINTKNAPDYVNQFKEYYDCVMYFPGVKCVTCDTIKPARSKHCRVCNVCVSRFDHHCVWIRQCVGQKNYKFFLKFIGMHALLCNYGGYFGVKALYGQALKLNLFNMQFRYSTQKKYFFLLYRNSLSQEIYQSTYATVIQYLFYTETMFFFITILCWVMGVTLLIFFIYHLFMVKYNTTTNERIKRSDFREYFVQHVIQMRAQVLLESDKEMVVKITQKIDKFEQNIKKLDSVQNLGFIKGLQLVFGQPNEVKWRAVKQSIKQ